MNTTLMLPPSPDRRWTLAKQLGLSTAERDLGWTPEHTWREAEDEAVERPNFE
ncbi:hypothetical protein HYG81_01610 [Natrinema zhouii]|uniref:Uncharacterized protein n=1 Tax=Natrinema zhouii TaxID=1710539 RepID=A0A7D6CM14_9EURY|nr:hypothetical protein [Natrinema zhouii]QLK24315.1 hypothetical protein HYG81_01610 [Natrinema zhouii]